MLYIIDALAPPASQHHSGLGTEIKNVDKLSEEQKNCCDDMILKLGDANGTNELPNEPEINNNPSLKGQIR